MIKLVEPPTAAFTTMAFSNASLVRILESFKSSFTISTILLPDSWANSFFLESTAGMAAAPGSVSPNASAMQAMVDAVPMVMQCPALLATPISASMMSSAE